MNNHRTFSKAEKYRAARVSALSAVCGYDKSFSGGNYYDLMKLLGYKYPLDNYPTFTSIMTDRDYETCLALAGPHSYAVYKMLKAKREP